MQIGFIGLGLMGVPMARNICEKGGNLFVWNRTPDRADALVSLGAKLCKSKKELAENADILITMVTAGEDVEEVLFGKEGMAEYLKKGSIVIDMSTIGVEWARSLGSKLTENGTHFLDAPVTGSTPKAITGELTIFIGGEQQIFEKAKPVLSLMGTNLQYMGTQGNGQAMKLLNNMLVAYSMIGLSEIMKLAEGMHLSQSRTAEVIKTLPVSSPYIGMKVDNFVKNEYPMMFSLQNMAKDITLAYNEMHKAGISLDMLISAKNLYDEGCEKGYGDMDVSAIGKLI